MPENTLRGFMGLDHLDPHDFMKPWILGMLFGMTLERSAQDALNQGNTQAVHHHRLLMGNVGKTIPFGETQLTNKEIEAMLAWFDQHAMKLIDFLP